MFLRTIQNDCKCIKIWHASLISSFQNQQPTVSRLLQNFLLNWLSIFFTPHFSVPKLRELCKWPIQMHWRLWVWCIKTNQCRYSIIVFAHQPRFEGGGPRLPARDQQQSRAEEHEGHAHVKVRRNQKFAASFMFTFRWLEFQKLLLLLYATSANTLLLASVYS